MKLPYHVSCVESHPRLYQLSDGRFQIMEEGELPPLMVGYEYVLVETGLAEFASMLDLPRLDIIDAVIYDRRQKREIRSYRQFLIGQCFSSDMIRDIDLEGERFLVMDRSYLFASPLLKQRLENAGFGYLRFTEGLNEFAGRET
jgi:hypothetical protein